MLIALSGTPGVGKSTVATTLSEKGLVVVELSRVIKEKNLMGAFDEARGTYEVDVDRLDIEISEFHSGDPLILVGHLSHLLSVELIIILRCSPSLLKERLSGRGWGESKVHENMEAEACDVILIEALDSGVEVCEIDTTDLSPLAVVDAVEEILQGEREKYAPGNIDWSEEVLGWF
ncbi:MAG: AAA family ATPase [Methanomassiliicoccales archaeon]|nr:AAA family ATPase [Methanomassiliicoccales archaeon]NYT15091.1 AAA family ATPase [Methanomassiliicoccales archaeon]